MADLADKRVIQTDRGVMKRMVCEYDFAKDGGATGTYNAFVAASALVIYGVYAHVKTTFAGSSAAMELGDTAQDDVFLASSAVGSWTAGSLLQSVTGVTPRLLAEGSAITFKIQTAALTAGKADLIIDYAEF